MFITVIIITLIIFAVFYRYYPPFGGKTSKQILKSSPNFRHNVFINQITTSMNISLRDVYSIIHDRRQSGLNLAPRPPFRPEIVDVPAFLASTTPQLIWLGHSTVLIRVNGKTLLTDPILSKRSSPFPFVGPKRLISEIPISAADLPPIDAVVISHDHYDHLDYKTIRALEPKTTRFFVSLGVAAHLRRWGMPNEKISEQDWWSTTEFEGMKMTSTPARHFSGRTATDRNKTLWSSWVIDTPAAKIFLSGDTGYGPHFQVIGETFGPFDLTLMECGQYDRRWASIHMTPEEGVKAHLDLRGKRMFPVHWGAFVLALHPWADSVKRAEIEARAKHVTLISGKLGQLVDMKRDTTTPHHWWDSPLN